MIAHPLNPLLPAVLVMSSLSTTTHTPSPLHFSDCRTSLPSCSCYTIPFPNFSYPVWPILPLSPSAPYILARDFPAIYSSSDLTRGISSSSLQSSFLPPVPYTFSVFSPFFCIEMAGPNCMSRSQSHSGEWDMAGKGSKMGGKFCLPFSFLSIHPFCYFSFSPLVNTSNLL